MVHTEKQASMNLLRRIPLTRLLALCAIAVIAVAGVALAATGGGGAKPPRRSLAAALRQTLAAKPVPGVTATISFTNNLFGAGLLPRSQPLLSGGTGRLWASANGQVRLELQSDRGDTEIYFDHGVVSYFDPSSRTLYRVALPQRAADQTPASGSDKHALPTVATIQSALTGLMQHAGVSGAQPSNVAGQPAYRVKISPSNGGLVGGVALWWDAARGVPLRIAIYASHQSAPVVQLTARHISYTVDSSAFNVPTPAKTVDLKLPSPPSGSQAAGHRHAGAHQAKPASVQALRSALGVPVSAPASLSGLPRTGTELVTWGGQPAALLTYGSGLGGIAILEQKASPDSAAKPVAPSNQGDGQQQPSLPTVKINGSPGSALSTPLGSLVRFTRAGVTYTLLGSVPARTAMTAARGL